MKKMKWVSAVLALALVASLLTGCWGRRKEEETTRETTTEATSEERTTQEQSSFEETRTQGTRGDDEPGTDEGLIGDLENGIDEIGDDISEGMNEGTTSTTRTDTGYTAARE